MTSSAVSGRQVSGFAKEKSGSDAAYKITDAEAKSYYNEHVQMFIIPVIQLFYCNIGDTVKYTEAEIKKKMKEFSALVSDEFKTGDKENYMITFTKTEAFRPMMTSMPLCRIKPGDFAERMNGGRKLVYLLTNKTPEVPQPFEKVKETCFGNLLNEKRTKQSDAFIERVKQKYPVVLTSDLFK